MYVCTYGWRELKVVIKRVRRPRHVSAVSRDRVTSPCVCAGFFWPEEAARVVLGERELDMCTHRRAGIGGVKLYVRAWYDRDDEFERRIALRPAMNPEWHEFFR